jgi:hypothetical protein
LLQVGVAVEMRMEIPMEAVAALVVTENLQVNLYRLELHTPLP